jgi:hypothetical protein
VRKHWLAVVMLALFAQIDRTYAIERATHARTHARTRGRDREGRLLSDAHSLAR